MTNTVHPTWTDEQIALGKARMIQLKRKKLSNSPRAVGEVSVETGLPTGLLNRINVLARFSRIRPAEIDDTATPAPDAVVQPAAQPSLPATALLSELFRIDLKTRAVVWSATGENAQHATDVWSDEPIVLLGFYALRPVDVMAVLTLGEWPGSAEDLTPSIRRSDWAEAQRRFYRNAKALETSHAA